MKTEDIPQAREEMGEASLHALRAEGICFLILTEPWRGSRTLGKNVLVVCPWTLTKGFCGPKAPQRAPPPDPKHSSLFICVSMIEEPHGLTILTQDLQTVPQSFGARTKNN